MLKLASVIACFCDLGVAARLCPADIAVIHGHMAVAKLVASQFRPYGQFLLVRRTFY